MRLSYQIIISLKSIGQAKTTPDPDENPERSAIYHENMQELKRLLCKIKIERNMEMVMMRYGLHDGDEWTFRKIADYFDLSPARAREIILNSMRKMRRHIRYEDWAD